MPRYIDAEKLEKRLKDFSCWCLDGRKSGVDFVLDCVLPDSPDVNISAVKQGEWLLRHVGSGHYWECSVCHKNPCIYVTEHTKYCPNCGAQMGDE